MCLVGSSIKTTNLEQITKGYKVGRFVVRRARGRAPKVVFISSDWRHVFPIGKWEEDAAKGTLPAEDNTFEVAPRYPKGFHVFHNLKDARRYCWSDLDEVVEVEVDPKSIVCQGVQRTFGDRYPCSVARRIKVLGTTQEE